MWYRIFQSPYIYWHLQAEISERANPLTSSREESRVRTQETLNAIRPIPCYERSTTTNRKSQKASTLTSTSNKEELEEKNKKSYARLISEPELSCSTRKQNSKNNEEAVFSLGCSDHYTDPPDCINHSGVNHVQHMRDWTISVIYAFS
ncbi:hypothetical protein FQR65_LT02038 [Abscondita terminalis]|nr:hypothetical protein FQR65_LT02038 [Abscondita terminalis]